MTIPENIVAFVRGGKPGAFCDDCIKTGLNLASEAGCCDSHPDPVFMQWVSTGTREL
jgi:hypothetical protein